MSKKPRVASIRAKVAAWNTDPGRIEEIVSRFKILADPSRLMILSIISYGDVRAYDLELCVDLKRATIMSHVRALIGVGFIARMDDGRLVICPEAFAALRQWFGAS